MKLYKQIKIKDIIIEKAPQNKLQQESLVLRGQRNPIRLRRRAEDGKFDIVDGRRRIVDLLGLGNEVVQAIVYDEKELDDESLHLDALTLNAGKPNPMDEALHIQWLMSYKNWTEQDIAEAIGYSVSTVLNRLDLVLKLIKDYQEELKVGNIKLSAVLELVKCPAEVQQGFFNDGLRKIKEITQAVRNYRDSKLVTNLPVEVIESFVEPKLVAGLFIEPEEVKKLIDGEEVAIEIRGESYILNMESKASWLCKPSKENVRKDVGNNDER